MLDVPVKQHSVCAQGNCRQHTNSPPNCNLPSCNELVSSTAVKTFGDVAAQYPTPRAPPNNTLLLHQAPGTHAVSKQACAPCDSPPTRFGLLRLSA
jgi:hypothetical protein